MKKIFLIGVLSILIQGCSNNIAPYRPNPSECKLIAKKLKNVFVAVKTRDPENNSIGCRMLGPIYTPGKVSFQHYIQKAFDNTLAYTDSLAKDQNSASYVIEVNIDDINSNTISGEWTIRGTVAINGGPPMNLNSVTRYGTAYVAWTACENAAGAFSHATEEFIGLVFSKIR